MTTLRPSDFDFDLPSDRIAQEPCGERDAARLLVHRADEEETTHAQVRDLADFLAPGDLLVLNDTRVLPTRLFGRRRSGGRVEVLLVEPLGDPPGAWKAFVNPARKPKPGERIPLEGGALEARMIERPLGPDGTPAMEWIVEIAGPEGEAVEDLLERHGHVPLPPYIHRDEAEGQQELDRERYQTVYASRPGAVAAPTAGLHFTERLLARLEDSGIRRATVTLHVGPGTFRPVKTDRIEDHRMHTERYDLPAATVEAIARTRRDGGRIVAVGTTSTRVLEGRAREDGTLEPGPGETNLFLRPGSRFRVIDALLTNFHLPRSSLLMLVSALVGRERILHLYREAVDRRYRFYSYGDAMLLFRASGGGCASE